MILMSHCPLLRHCLAEPKGSDCTGSVPAASGGGVGIDEKSSAWSMESDGPFAAAQQIG